MSVPRILQVQTSVHMTLLSPLRCESFLEIGYLGFDGFWIIKGVDKVANGQTLLVVDDGCRWWCRC